MLPLFFLVFQFYLSTCPTRKELLDHCEICSKLSHSLEEKNKKKKKKKIIQQIMVYKYDLEILDEVVKSFIRYNQRYRR